jgi:hypothetical protein
MQPEQQVAGVNWEQKVQVMLTCWAGHGVSTDTHTGVSYGQYSHGRVWGHLLRCCEVES